MPGPQSATPILVVDDDRGMLRLMEKALQREGFSTATATSAAEATGWLEAHRAPLMLLDLKLEDLAGPELVHKLKQVKGCPPFIIITGQGDERVAVQMMKAGALDYLVKDAELLERLPAVVRRAMEQLENERRLQEAEEQVHLIRSAVEQGFSAVVIANAELPDPLILYVNPAFCKTTGYPEESVVSHRLSSVASLRTLQERLAAGWPEGEIYLEGGSTFTSASGERWGEWRVSPVRDKRGVINHWLIIFRDITERKRLEKEILEISDLERQRLGQDLHDGLCQHLAGIELMAQVLEQKLATRSKADAARAGELARFVRDAITQTRALARGLSPVTLESEGLISGLYELAANTEKMFGVSCRLTTVGLPAFRSPAASTHLYRIAQEAVSNAIKHGKARQITLEVREQPDRTVLSVDDNGTGFTAPAASAPGMGLRIMQYRAGMLGGVLVIEKSPLGGARIVCSVPSEPAAGKEPAA